MSASQLTPKANPLSLPLEKSLPPPPLDTSVSRSDETFDTSASPPYTAKTVKGLPPRPNWQRSWTEHRPSTADTSAVEPLLLASVPRSRSSGNTASFLDFGPDTPQLPLFPSSSEALPTHAFHSQQSQDVECKYKTGPRVALSGRMSALQVSPEALILTSSFALVSSLNTLNLAPHHGSFRTSDSDKSLSVASSSQDSSPPQPFYSPVFNAPTSPQSALRSSSMSPAKATRPSLPAQWKSDTPSTPPRLSSAEAAKFPESPAFPVLGGRADDSAESSPASQRLSSTHTRLSTDYSFRNSASTTHTSIWTESSLASAGTSPACTQYGLNDTADGAGCQKSAEAADSTEELDENSVGLGITSDDEHDVCSRNRRSSAVPVVPAPMLPGSAKALQGPFAHHRAPSWTRRVSPPSGLHYQYPTYELGSDGALRSLGLSVQPQMQRALSDVTPSSASEDVAAAIASASSSVDAPLIPLRRDSRIRCASDSGNYNPTASSPIRHSPSVSVSSSASNSGRFTPTLPTLSDPAGSSDLSSLRSPPRKSSLRPSPSSSSLRGSPCAASIKDGSQRTPPPLAPRSPRRPPPPSLERIATTNDIGSSVIAVQQAPTETASGRDSPFVSPREPPMRTTSALSRARRVSDISVSSFLQNGEFNHIGAYTSRMRWEEGLYDFDESAEMDGDESRAVKTAEEGSATIVQGRDLTLEQIEAETGPNTTHLLLGNNRAEGLLEVLERVLPLATNLLVLDLSNCGLERLPDAIGSCIALEELDISGNPVGHLPDWLLNLRALRTLSADRIDLHHLPSSLIQLQELQRLSLRKNELVFLPSWLHRMSKLSNLFVEGNHFRGPWRDIVAPLLSPGDQPVPTLQRPILSPLAGLHAGGRSITTGSLAQVPERPNVARMRSANDLQTMLASAFGAPTPTVATPQFEIIGSGYIRPIDTQPRVPTDYGKLPSPIEADSNATGGGRWGGLLKKIGRKASSHKLASAYREQPGSLTESPFTSPRASRKSLRSSAGLSRTNSTKDGPAASMAPSQSEASTSIAQASQSLAAAVSEAPMTPLEATTEPETSAEPTSLLQPIALDADAAKKARRRSFLPVQVFAAANAAAVSQSEAYTSPSGIQEQEMDEESLAMHRNRLRALMHYLRDLDDLTAARTEAASFVGPSKSNLAQLREANSHSRSPSMHQAGSSNPSTKSRDSGGEYVASTAPSSVSEGTASTDPARLSTAECSKDDSVRRFRIIAEIVSTERTYVKGLAELVDIYVKPAMAPADGNSGVPVIPCNEHRAVFGNVEALLQFHRGVFLPLLLTVAAPLLDHDQEKAAEMAPEETAAIAEKIAAVFTDHAAFFKMYSSYINNCDSAQSHISAWMAGPTASNGGGLSLRGTSGYNALQALGAMSAQQGSLAGAGSMMGGSSPDCNLTASQRKKIKTFMKRCRTHPRHTQLNVESYLLLPVQRIPRYRLLLEDLVKSTDTSRLSDADSLATALEHVTQIASKVNESKRQSEQDRRLLAWQYRIRGPIEGPLVQPHRRLLKDGSLQLKRVVRRIPGFVRSNRSASVGGSMQLHGGFLSPLDMPGSDHVLSADHLQQVTEDQTMSLVLCSDVAALCVDQTRGKDASAPVLLRSMIKLIRPVEILGGVNLRVVDRSEILYLAAAKPEEAVAWKTAFDLHFYQ